MLRRQGCCKVASPSSQNPHLKLVIPQTVSHIEAGVSDINTAIISSENGRFVLHDSQGFEHREGENFQKVVDFLKARKDMPNVRDRVHAVWYVYRPSITCTMVIKTLRRLCIQVSVSGRDYLSAPWAEELFRMKSRGELGPGRFSTFSDRRWLTVRSSSCDRRFYEV